MNYSPIYDFEYDYPFFESENVQNNTQTPTQVPAPSEQNEELVEFSDMEMVDAPEANISPTQNILGLDSKHDKEKFLDDLAKTQIETIPENLSHSFNNSLFAKIHGDKIIPSSDLEGGNPSRNLEFIQKVLTHLNDPIYSKVIEEFRELYKLSEKIDNLNRDTPLQAQSLLEEIISKIQNLHEGESFLFPGGWSNKGGGHFIIYEVVKRANSYDFKLINTGGGTVYHERISVGSKTYVDPVYLITNINEDRMTSEIFWKHAIDLNVYRYEGAKEIKSDDVYCKLITLLQGTVVSEPNVENRYITPQHDGTCSWKAFMAFIKYRIGKQDASYAIIAFKYWSIVNYLQSNPQANFTTCQLLKKAAQGLSKHSKSFFFEKNKEITENLDFPLHIAAVCRAAEKYGDLNDDVKTFIDIANLNFKFSSQDRILNKGITTPSINADIDQSINVNTQQIEPPPILIDTENPIVWLKQWQEFLNIHSNTQTENYAYVCLEQMLENLPLPLVGISLDCYKEVFQEFFQIANAYFDFILKSSSKEKISQFSINMIHLYFTLDEIAYHLFRQMGIDLKEWNLFIPILSFEDIYKKLSEVNPANHVRFKKLQTYLNSRNKQEDKASNKLFWYPITDENLSLKINTDSQDYAEINLIKNILEKKNVKGNFFWAIVRAFTGENTNGIPDEFYQLRNISLRCQFITQAKTLNDLRLNGCNPIFTHPFTSEKSKTCTLTLQNVDKNNKNYPIKCRNDLDIMKYDLYNENNPKSQNKAWEVARIGKATDCTEYEYVRLFDMNHATGAAILLAINFYQDRFFLLQTKKHLQNLHDIFFSMNQAQLNLQSINNFSSIASSFLLKALSHYSNNNPKDKIIFNQLLQIAFFFSKILLSEGYSNDAFEFFAEVRKRTIHHFKLEIDNPEIITKEINSLLLIFKIFAADPPKDIDELELLINCLCLFGVHYPHNEWISTETIPLYKWLENQLQSPENRNFIFAKIPFLSELPMDVSEKHWDGNFPTFLCNEWSFSLLNGKISHPRIYSLQAIQNCIINGIPLKYIIGEEIHHLKLDGESYTNESQNLAITVNPLKLHKTNNFEFLGLVENIQHLLNNQFLDSKTVDNVSNPLLVWQNSSSGTLEITDRKLTFLYTLKGSQNKWRVNDSKGRSLTFSTSFTPLPLHNLLNTENPNLLLRWVDKGQITEINLPSLQLNLNKKNKKWEVKELEGLFVSQKIFTSPFQSFPSPIFLENQNGKYFGLIPNRNVIEDRSDEFNELFRVKNYQPTNFNFKNKKNDFYVYNFDPESNSLIPIDIKSAFYLAFIYFVDHNYDKAIDILKKCTKTTNYDSDEMKELSKILNYKGSINCFQLAIVMHVYWLAYNASKNGKIANGNHVDSSDDSSTSNLKNGKIANGNQDENSEDSARRTKYTYYLNQLESIPVKYRLNTTQEKELIYSTPYAKYTTLSARLNFLEGKDSNSDSIIFHQKAEIRISQVTITKVREFLNEKSDEEVQPEPESPNHEFLGISSPSQVLTPKMCKDLILSLFSNNPHETIEAEAKILFFNQSDQSSKGVNALNFLKLLMNLKVDYIKYLANANLEITLENILNHYIKFHPRKIQEPLSSDDKRTRHNSNTIKPNTIKPTQSKLLKPNVERLAENSLHVDFENDRKNILEKYLSSSTESIDLHAWIPNAHSKAYEQLRLSPLARKLFSAYFSNQTIEKENWEWSESWFASKPFLIEKLGEDTEAFRSELMRTSKELSESILSLANRSPMDVSSFSITELQNLVQNRMEVSMGKRPSITVESLVLFILRDDWTKIGELNEYIDQELSEALFSKMINWLSIQVEISLLAKIEEKVSQFLEALKRNCSDKEQNHLTSQICALLNSSRHYEISKFPQLLAFEYVAGLQLRQKQASVLGNAKSDLTNHLFKLMMGEGKTKVILPALAALLADGVRFPLIIVPQSMYDQNLKDLKTVSENLLGQRVFTYKYYRGYPSTSEVWKNFNSYLDEIIEGKSFLVITPETIQSMLLTYKELLIDSLKDNNTSSDIRRNLAQVLLKIKERAIAIFDESHVSLRALQEVNFTLHADRQLSREEIESTLEIFENINWDNFLEPIETKSAAGIFANFRNFIIPELYPKPNEQPIRDYLQGGDPTIVEQIFEKNPPLASKIALAKEQIWTLLPFTLSKGLNLYYGESPKSQIDYAIPYIGNDKPNLYSEFGNRHVMINFTIQMYLQQGLNLTQFKNWITLYKQHILDDSFASNNYLKGISLDEISINNEEQMKDLHSRFNRSSPIVLDFLRKILLPTLRFHTKKISSNAQDLGDFLFNRIILLSGTPYNRDTYPLNLSNLNMEISKEEYQLINTLFEERNSKIEIIPNKKSEDVILRLVQCTQKDPAIRSIIDLGAYFRGIKNEEVARKILNALTHIPGIIFFSDQTNELVLLKRGERIAEPFHEQSWPTHKFFVYFDNIHAFGADVQMLIDTQGIVTIGSETCFYEILQAIKRLRLLEFGQSFRFMISDFIAQYIKQMHSVDAVQVKDILLYGIFNEADSLEKEIIVSTQHKINHTVKKEIVLQSYRKNAQNNSANVLADDIFATPFESYRNFDQEISPQEYFSKSAEPLMSQLTLPAAKTKEIQQNLKNIIEAACNVLPPKIHTSFSKGMNQEMQKQEEKKMEASSLRDTTFTAISEDPFQLSYLDEWNPNQAIANWEKYNHDKSFKFLSFNKALQIINKFENEPNIFELNLFMTQNFLRTTFDLKWSIPIKFVDFILCFKTTPQEFSYLLISIKEFNQIAPYLNNRTTKNRHMHILDICGRHVTGDPILPEDESSYILSKDRALTQIQFFNGNDFIPKENEPFLTQWASNQEETLLNLFDSLKANRSENKIPVNGNVINTINLSRAITLERNNAEMADMADAIDSEESKNRTEKRKAEGFEDSEHKPKKHKKESISKD